MKYKNSILFFLSVFLCVGIFFISYSRFESTRQKTHQKILHQGQTLVRWISLAYEGHQEPKKKTEFIKELSLLVSDPDVAYLVIHKAPMDTPFIELPYKWIWSTPPEAVKVGSLAGIGFQTQEFIAADGTPYIEFSKPVYMDGQTAATVRLGMRSPKNLFFAMENFILPFQELFFVIMALVLGYYWLLQLLKPIQKKSLHNPASALGPTPDDTAAAMIRQLDHALVTAREELGFATWETRELTAKATVLEYENCQLYSIFNSIDFGVLMVDIQDSVFFINDYFLRLLGKELKSLMGASILEAVDHPELLSFVQQQDLMEQGRGASQRELSFPDIFADKVFLISAMPLIDGDGAAFGKLFKLVDVTREKASEKSQQDFINHIAHELRTPLTNIKAYNEMMMDGEISDLDMQKEFFNTINDETNRLSILIKNILELAETEMGHLVLKKEMVQTKWLFQSCMDSVEAMAQEKSIRLKTHLPDNLPYISGDKEMLKSALINVLANAVKYTPESGEVDFSILETPETVVFEITDNGYGISDVDLPHIFDKFYRAENDQITSQTGSGLGLSITAEIIKIHGGAIVVDSEPGKGSRFKITISKGDVQIG